jgi:DNA invertase Pin-like site-specific DNA recombinase
MTLKNKKSGQFVGYARVSSRGQSLEIQLEQLNKYGCSKIFSEKISGVDLKRPQLNNCMDYIRDGDTLIITKLDRFGRNTRDLLNLVYVLENKGASLLILDQNIDTSTTMGKIMINMLAIFAEFENNIRKERQSDGIKKALKKGVKFGATNKLTNEQIKEMIDKSNDMDNKISITELVKEYGISRASFYRFKKAYNGIK